MQSPKKTAVQIKPVDKEARDVLETCNLKSFIKFVEEHEEEINFQLRFPTEDNINFPMVLVQIFRKLENIKKGQTDLMEEDFITCMQLLVHNGAEINFQDKLGRTVCHWAVLLQSICLLGEALELGCDPLLQDNEGQTIAHLAVRLGCMASLDTIKKKVDSIAAFEETSVCSGATPLIYAVQIGALNTVKKIIKFQVDPNKQEKNKYKRTALHYAFFINRTDIFEVMLKAGAKATIPDYNKKTVMERAKDSPSKQYIRLINMQQLKDNAQPTNAVTSLMIACQNENVDAVRELLQKGEEDIFSTDEDLRTALHHCAEHRNTSCASKLLAHSSSLIDMRDRNGFTTLHLATVAGNTELMTLLLKKGANINITDVENHTCLHWAVVCSQIGSIDVLTEHKASLSLPDMFGAHPLHYATQSFVNKDGDIVGQPILERLLKHGAPPDCVDKEERTPLLWAASLGVAKCCSILLEAGANLTHQDTAGLTALHCAASRGQYQVLELLLSEYHMEVDCVDKNGCTALFYAVTLKQTDIVEMLLFRNSNPNHQDNRGRSAAHCAAVKGHVGILDLIKMNGGNIWLQNEKKVYPMHEACEAGHISVAKFIVDRSTPAYLVTKLNDHNDFGYSCLHVAAEAGHVDICEFLLDNGADVNAVTSNAPDGRGKTSYDLTTSNECRELLVSRGGLSIDIINPKEASISEINEENKSSLDEPDSLAIEYNTDTSTREIVQSPHLSPPGSKQPTPAGSPEKILSSFTPPPPASPTKKVISKQDSQTGKNTSVKTSQQSSPVKQSTPSPVKTTTRSPTKVPPIISPLKPEAVKSQNNSKEMSPVKIVSKLPPDTKQEILTNQMSQQSPKVDMKRTPTVAKFNGEVVQPVLNVGTCPQNRISRPALVRQQQPPNKITAGTASNTASRKAQSQPPNYKINGGPVEQVRKGTGSDTSSISSPDKKDKKSTLQQRGNKQTVSPNQPKKKSNIANQIAESVYQFESVRSTMREMAHIKRMQVFHGYVTDRTLMEELRNEYQRNFLYTQENENHTNGSFGSSTSITTNTTSSTGPRGSEESSDATESPQQQPATPIKKGKTVHNSSLITKNMSLLSKATKLELERDLRKTRKLYEDVQRQADETLREARKVNNALCDDLQKSRINAYVNVRSTNVRTSKNNTTTSSEAALQSRPFAVVKSTTIRQNRIKKAYGSPMGSSIMSSTSSLAGGAPSVADSVTSGSPTKSEIKATTSPPITQSVQARK